MSDDRQIESALVQAQRMIEAERQARCERSAKALQELLQHLEMVERTRLDVSMVLRNGVAPTIMLAFVPMD